MDMEDWDAEDWFGEWMRQRKKEARARRKLPPKEEWYDSERPHEWDPKKPEGYPFTDEAWSELVEMVRRLRMEKDRRDREWADLVARLDP